MRSKATLLRAGIGIATILLLAIPPLVTEAGARGGFGGGGGAHIGGGGGAHIGGGGGAHIGGGGGGIRSFGGGGGVGVRSFSGRIGGSGLGVRSFGGRSFSPSIAHGSRISPFVGGGNRFVGSSARTFTTAGALWRPAMFARPAGFARANFGNRFITNAAFKGSFAGSPAFFGRFGRLHGSHWPWWRGGIVIGWIGPVFWPYANYDFFDYVYWPYVYDGFWPYAYEDVYYGIYGGYAYVDPGVKAARSPRNVQAQGSQARASSICGEQAPQLTDWPIERITQAVEPTEAQRAMLDELKAATAKSIDILKAACPNDLPSVPSGRLNAMEGRLQVMLQAVQTVRPPLDRFYQSLSDEQKARFNAVSPSDTSAAGQDQRDLTRLCNERGVADLPIDRIAKAVRPTEAQQASLDELKAASVKAAEGLKGNCPAYQALTPTGRVETMEKRLEAMLEAVKTVQPALTKFYDSLTDEQKARFNTLGSTRPGA